MLLTALVTKAELTALLGALTPMRITIDEERGRTVTLGRPELTLIPGKGLRLRGDARIAWDVAGIAVPVTLQGWQVLLVPRIHVRDKTRLLAFEPVIEELDLKLVPAFLDDKIADAISEAIAKNRSRLAWNFARSLSKRLPLPARIAPAEMFEIAAVDGEVQVTEAELRFSVRFEARIERGDSAVRQRAAPAAGRQTEASPPSRPTPRAPRQAAR
jgi:hypothetical protein